MCPLSMITVLLRDLWINRHNDLFAKVFNNLSLLLFSELFRPKVSLVFYSKRNITEKEKFLIKNYWDSCEENLIFL